MVMEDNTVAKASVTAAALVTMPPTVRTAAQEPALTQETPGTFKKQSL